jgi:hypothetical protein
MVSLAVLTIHVPPEKISCFMLFVQSKENATGPGDMGDPAETIENRANDGVAHYSGTDLRQTNCIKKIYT